MRDREGRKMGLEAEGGVVGHGLVTMEFDILTAFRGSGC